MLKERKGRTHGSMSVATMNAFSLLDDEGTVDATELAAKIPMADKEAPKKAANEGKRLGALGTVASEPACEIDGGGVSWWIQIGFAWQ